MGKDMSDSNRGTAVADAQVVYIEAPITVGDLAVAVRKSPIDLLRILMNFGLMVPITQAIDFDTAEIVCSELGIVVKSQAADQEEPEGDETLPSHRANIQNIIQAEQNRNLQDRPLVITVLGHVDHGKTTLLDTIRKTNIVDTEAGGITQSTGAYQVQHTTDGHTQTLTFIDTPGHQAFTQMRARGAEVTDLVILVVAADDGIMPQTLEAIDHARAAQVPILVALNKMDRPNANLNNVMTQLANQGLTPAEWEGDTQVVPISALTGQNVDELLDTITLLTEEIAPKANPGGKAVGTVLESHVDRRKGVTTTLLVQNGTLCQGQHIVVGTAWGRIKAMNAYDGTRITKAGPSTPVQVLGIGTPPEAGEFFEFATSKKEAVRRVAEHEQEATQMEQTGTVAAPSLADFFEMMQAGDEKELRLVVRADVQGSLDPILSSLENINQDEAKIRVLRSAVGDVSESDVLLAEASQAIILGFNVIMERSAEVRAEKAGITIHLYRIIYELIEDVERALVGMLEPVFKEIVIGQAEVRQKFPVKGGVAAGCVVLDGVVKQDAQARLIRSGARERLTRIMELRRYQDRVDTVRMGQDCGIRLQNIDDFLDGDLIEVFEQQQQARVL